MVNVVITLRRDGTAAAREKKSVCASSCVSVLCNGYITCRLHDGCAGSYNKMAVFLGQ
jgi:hypothetical protein